MNEIRKSFKRDSFFVGTVRRRMKWVQDILTIVIQLSTAVEGCMKSVGGKATMYVALLTLMLTASPSFADGDALVPGYGTIVSFGVEATSAYFDLPELSAAASVRNCQWGLYYVDTTSAGGRVIYASLALARATGKKITRIAWTQSASGAQCFVSLLQISD